jgi:hypothetical protein
MSNAQTQEIRVARLHGMTLFRILFIGLLGFHVASTLLVMVLVLIGVLPVETAAQQPPITTVLAYVGAYLVLGILLSPFWVGMTWVCVWSGLRLYALFRPFRLSFVPSSDNAPT